MTHLTKLTARLVLAADGHKRAPYLQIGNLRISVCDDPNHIAISRDGEGGHFSLQELHGLLHKFVSERL